MLEDHWVVTWGDKKSDGKMEVKTEVIPAYPWLWMEAMTDEKHERLKNLAWANGKPTPPRPNNFVLLGCWKLKDIG